jgi:hypothetical protein
MSGQRITDQVVGLHRAENRMRSDLGGQRHDDPVREEGGG